MRTVIYEDSNVLIQLEDFEGEVFIHHHVFKWNKGTLKAMDKVVKETCELLKEQGCESLWSYFKPEQAHLYKFCNRYGFIVVSEKPHEVLVYKEL